jgi:hypothetical protein
MATEEVEVMYFLLSYTSNLSYIYPIFSSKKILYSYIIFVKSGLTPCHQIKTDARKASKTILLFPL